MTQPTPPAAPPAGGRVDVTLRPGSPPPPTPPQTPAPDPPVPPTAQAPGAEPPDEGPEFTNDRDRRRWAELTGRVGRFARERDEARAHVELLLRQAAERIAAATLAQPADLWLEASGVPDVLTEDGADVDPAKVQALAAGLVAKRPGLARPPEPRPRPGAPGLSVPGTRQTFAEVVGDMVKGRL